MTRPLDLHVDEGDNLLGRGGRREANTNTGRRAEAVKTTLT